MRKLKVTEMHRLSLDEFRQAEKLPLIVVLDDVRSRYNVGAMFRCADAFRVAGVWLCGITATPPDPEIHKTALGGEDSVSWRYFKTTEEAVAELRRQGVMVYSVEQCEGSVKIGLDTALPQDVEQPSAVILGNEVKGVKQSVVDLSDACLEIPQFGTKHSLNVASAAAIVIWEFARRHLQLGQSRQQP